jgi:undecaprenyl-diphosphatase
MMLEALLAWDEHVFSLINAAWVTPLLDRVMPAVTDGRNYNIPLLAAAIVVVLVGRLRGIRFVVLAIVGVVIADAIGTHIFKSWFSRSRPCIALENVRLLVGCTNLPSLPSNHAVNASVLATLAIREMPRLWLPAVGLTLLIGYSRVYVGVHYPLDVLVGSALGIAIALVLSAVMTMLWPPAVGSDDRRRMFSLRIGNASDSIGRR